MFWRKYASVPLTRMKRGYHKVHVTLSLLGSVVEETPSASIIVGHPYTMGMQVTLECIWR